MHWTAAPVVVGELHESTGTHTRSVRRHARWGHATHKGNKGGPRPAGCQERGDAAKVYEFVHDHLVGVGVQLGEERECGLGGLAALLAVVEVCEKPLRVARRG